MKTTKYFSVAQVAQRLGLSFRRTLALVHSNQLRARLVDHHYWIAGRELARFRRKMSRQGAPRSTIGPTDRSYGGGCAA